MAGNFGKFIDRSPVICAAGKPAGDPHGETVAASLRRYTRDDAVDALKHQAKIWKEDVFDPPLKPPPIKNSAFRGTETAIKSLLNPPVQTRYQTLLEDLKETVQDSYWNKKLGKGRDETPGLPAGTIPRDVTFGKPSVREISVKELVNPSDKTPYKVLWDSQVGHEMYRKTHQDYNPGERIDRGYESPPYVPTRCFGIKSRFDKRGIWVRCCCDWHIKEPVVHASKIQADFQERAIPQLGKVLAPNHNIDCVPAGHTFGDAGDRALYGVEELLKDGSYQPCIFKRHFYTWLSALSKIRVNLNVRRANGRLNFDEFYKKALYLDKAKSGFLPLKIFYELCSCPEINIAFSNMEMLLRTINIIANDAIDYRRFINLINSNAPPLEIQPFKDIPKESLYYVTTSQAASCDYLIIDNSDMPPAGTPSVRTDLERPIVPLGGSRADLDNMGDYTSVKTLLEPSIYTSYGLNYRDFFMPRSAEKMRKLFENIGYNFSGDKFEQIWKQGVELDQTGGVCVDTFKKLLKSTFHFQTWQLMR